MKKLSICSLGLILFFTIVSCKKYTSGTPWPVFDRKIRFQLYTDQDFSSNTSVIKFSLFIRGANGVLLDSALAPMEIKDIPNAANKLTFEKAVAGNSDLAAGFRYEIVNVGTSWFIDTCKAGTNYKVIDFNFR
ncbi:MAG TPA: hypothetical protein VGG71_13180 [Chitinophagaceae bacterium]|jgi:hypothetical protein